MCTEAGADRDGRAQRERLLTQHRMDSGIKIYVFPQRGGIFKWFWWPGIGPLPWFLPNLNKERRAAGPTALYLINTPSTNLTILNQSAGNGALRAGGKAHQAFVSDWEGKGKAGSLPSLLSVHGIPVCLTVWDLSSS